MSVNKLKIKKDDEVIVLTGKDKGKKGTVLRSIPASRRLFVSGINLVKRHEKASAASAGGIVSKEASIDISNVALLDPKDGKATKVGYKIVKDKKVRIARRSGDEINN